MACAWSRSSGVTPIVGWEATTSDKCQVETAATSKFFRDIWQTGRAIVPADGWYEWKKDAANPKIKQPYYITLRSGEPMFFAALRAVSARRLAGTPRRRRLCCHYVI